MPYLGDVAFWVAHHAATGETVSEAVARTIAGYWTTGPGALHALATGAQVDRTDLLDDLAGALCQARAAGQDTTELFALKAWALEHC